MARKGKIAVRVAVSTAAIKAMMVVMGCLKMNISAKVICWGGQVGWRRLTAARKWPERVGVAAKIKCKNTVTSNDCSISGGDGGYRQISDREVVMAVSIRWPMASQCDHNIKVKIHKIIGNL